MQRLTVALALLAAYFVAASVPAEAQGTAALGEGVVEEVTDDTIKLREEKRTNIYRVSDELLTNTGRPEHDLGFGSRVTEIKRGDKIQILYFNRGGNLICYLIQILAHPAEEKGGKEKEEMPQQEKGDFNFGKTGDRSG